MGFLKGLFKSKEKTRDSEPKAAKDVIQQENERYNQQVSKQDPKEPLTDEMLIKTFVEFFTPNKQFYSVPGTPAYTAYFNAINAAKVEMLMNPVIFQAATKRTRGDLLEMIKNPKPGVTSMLVCGLIFHTGKYATIQDALFCVDFSEQIPNCIALYLLLIAQSKPEQQRTQLIDAGTGTDKQPLTQAIDALKGLDPAWQCRIL